MLLYPFVTVFDAFQCKKVHLGTNITVTLGDCHCHRCHCVEPLCLSAFSHLAAGWHHWMISHVWFGTDAPFPPPPSRTAASSPSAAVGKTSASCVASRRVGFWGGGVPPEMASPPLWPFSLSLSQSSSVRSKGQPAVAKSWGNGSKFFRWYPSLGKSCASLLEASLLPGVQQYPSSLAQDFKDEDLGNSPGWLAASQTT